jgi:hypothetical protein
MITLHRLAKAEFRRAARWYRRWIRLKRFPFILVVHEDAAGEYFIVAVAHTSRRHGYWQKRM